MEPAVAVLLVVAAVLAVLLGWAWVQYRRADARARQAVRDRADALARQAELEQQYKETRSYLEAIGSANLDALLLLDRNRQIVWGNAVVWEMFGDGQPALGQTFIGLAHDYELNQAVLDAMAGHRPIVRQAAVNNRTLRILAAPIEETGGLAVAVEDVTELQRLGRARRDLIANISHELRTPLANIDLAAQTLRSGGSRDTALTRRMLDQIAVQVQSLSQLSQEMMDLAQIESGQALLKLVPVEAESLIRRSVVTLLPQAAMKGQHVSLVAPGGLKVLADEQQVSRVIGNLVHNAIKFTPEGGIISVHAEAVNEEDVQFCVADSGPGIPEEEQPRVFERFYKQDRARSKGGTGLGLAIARHIVEGHGGRIWVESTSGQGATFCFTLPRA
jgi:two-component system phosphate regulon sensor histidine kinase PhoR